MRSTTHRPQFILLPLVGIMLASGVAAFGHGTVVHPMSRVYRVYLSNPENPSFAYARAAVAMDGTCSYYTWNELSQNIPEAVEAGLPPGFDYSPWVGDGEIASGGRLDPAEFARTYAGLDQVGPQWPATSVNPGETIEVDFLATAPHDPSVWDVWITTADWDPNSALNWAQMEYLGRPSVTLLKSHYYFDLQIPPDRSGRHVLWVAWQRDDPVGEVFFSTSDLMISSGDGPASFVRADSNADGVLDISDPVLTLFSLFVDAGPGPSCWKPLDADDDGVVDLSDAIYTLMFFFQGGPAPRLPFPACGEDPTDDALADCESSQPSC
jgi:chitin-binding protein